uniref:Uncharacterized protein n=1 Tax=Glossina brevipalpis TaxID=37001 RepID=A0A1A9WJC0_9MUSC
MTEDLQLNSKIRNNVYTTSYMVPLIENIEIKLSVEQIELHLILNVEVEINDWIDFIVILYMNGFLLAANNRLLYVSIIMQIRTILIAFYMNSYCFAILTIVTHAITESNDAYKCRASVDLRNFHAPEKH